MPYFTGVCLTSSTFTLPTTTLSPNWSQILSKIGAIALQGPHHSAQKSTITSLSELITSSSKFSSVIFIRIYSFIRHKFSKSFKYKLLNLYDLF